MIRGGFLLVFSSLSIQLQMTLNSGNLTGSSCNKCMRYIFSRTGFGKSQNPFIVASCSSVGGRWKCCELDVIVVKRLDVGRISRGGCCQQEVVCNIILIRDSIWPFLLSHVESDPFSTLSPRKKHVIRAVASERAFIAICTDPSGLLIPAPLTLGW